MLNYKKIDNNYVVDEGYIFKHKKRNVICKMLRVGFSNVEDYDIIPEPIPEETEQEVII